MVGSLLFCKEVQPFSDNSSRGTRRYSGIRPHRSSWRGSTTCLAVLTSGYRSRGGGPLRKHSSRGRSGPCPKDARFELAGRYERPSVTRATSSPGLAPSLRFRGREPAEPTDSPARPKSRAPGKHCCIRHSGSEMRNSRDIDGTLQKLRPVQPQEPEAGSRGFVEQFAVDGTPSAWESRQTRTRGPARGPHRPAWDV